eukprot:8273096-Pyramimonas_sp.AAC.1
MVAEVLDKLVAEGGAAAAKNFLGQRTGPARELETVLAVYIKHALHWGESAQILAQLTDYELPFLRKQVGARLWRNVFGFGDPLTEKPNQDATLMRNRPDARTKY